MFAISDSTLNALKEPTGKRWDNEASQYLFSQYPNYFKALRASDEDVRQLVQSVRNKVRQFGITERREVLKLVVVAVSLGTFFFDDPRFNHQICESLDDTTRGSEERVEAVVTSSIEWIAYVWNETGLAEFGERLTTALTLSANDLNDREAVLKVLKFTLLGQWRVMDEEANIDFFANCFAYASEQGLSENVARTAYTACSMAHGMQWWIDPQFRYLRSLFEKNEFSADLIRRLAIFYQGFA